MKRLIPFTFLATLIITGCKKKGCTDMEADNYNVEAEKDDGSCTYDNNGNNGGSSLTIDSPVQFTMTVDGSEETSSNNSNLSAVASSDKNVGSSTTDATWNSAFYDNTNNYDVIIVSKGIMNYTNGSSTDAAMANYFDSGNVSFSSGGSNGITIAYGDGNGGIYRSDFGDQTGSNFEIIGKSIETIGGDQHVKIYAEFNCKVYQIGNVSNFKTITNGVFINHYADI